jgi:hypothetical protein
MTTSGAAAAILRTAAHPMDALYPEEDLIAFRYPTLFQPIASTP